MIIFNSVIHRKSKMRVTRKQLNEMIKEEMFNKVLSEGLENKLYGVSMHDLLDFAQAYASLGKAM